MIGRRSLIAGMGAVLAAPALARTRVPGANDRIRMAVIGVNGRGVALMRAVRATTGCEVSHLVDVDSQVLAKRLGEFAATVPVPPKAEGDYRRVLDRRDVDAVVIVTPDHWHARMAIDALSAGKHVYVEKPHSFAPAEGRALIAAEKRFGRVVQVGNQQRSAKETQELIGLCRSGGLGDIYEVQTWYGNDRKSIGRGSIVPPPAHLDWEMWQGPRPRAPFRSNLVHYNWHWFWKYGTGEICNNALHEVDIARMAMGVSWPERVDAHGARRFHVGDDWEMYDTMALDFRYPGGRTIRWDGHSCNKLERFGRGRGALVVGTKGSALVDRNGFEIFDLSGASLRRVTAAEASATTNTVGEGALDRLHMDNFAGVIRGTEAAVASPLADVDISTTICHLGNIAYRLGRSIRVSAADGEPEGADAQALMRVDYHPGMEIAG